MPKLPDQLRRRYDPRPQLALQEFGWCSVGPAARCSRRLAGSRTIRPEAEHYTPSLPDSLRCLPMEPATAAGQIPFRILWAVRPGTGRSHCPFRLATCHSSLVTPPRPRRRHLHQRQSQSQRRLHPGGTRPRMDCSLPVHLENQRPRNRQPAHPLYLERPRTTWRPAPRPGAGRHQ
jgi:hypothetical protein